MQLSIPGNSPGDYFVYLTPDVLAVRPQTTSATNNRTAALITGYPAIPATHRSGALKPVSSVLMTSPDAKSIGLALGIDEQAGNIVYDEKAALAEIRRALTEEKSPTESRHMTMPGY